MTIKLDSTGTPHILFYDNVFSNFDHDNILKYITFNGSNWNAKNITTYTEDIRSEVDGKSDYGGIASFALDSAGTPIT